MLVVCVCVCLNAEKTLQYINILNVININSKYILKVSTLHYSLLYIICYYIVNSTSIISLTLYDFSICANIFVHT